MPLWLPFFERLAEHYEVWVPEHPGFGGSDDPAWIPTSNEHVVREWGQDRTATAIAASQMNVAAHGNVSDGKRSQAGAVVLARSVASLDFNPFPQSNLAGALVYYSVEKRAKPDECVQQAAGKKEPQDTQTIGGMNFVHGHDEHGGVCVEARDDVYTAFRKGACYRFDLELNTFCSVSSGRFTSTPRCVRGSAAMKMISSTRSTSMSGVTFMSELACGTSAL